MQTYSRARATSQPSSGSKLAIGQDSWHNAHAEIAGGVDKNLFHNDDFPQEAGQTGIPSFLNDLASDIEFPSGYSRQAALIVARYQYGLSLHELVRRETAAGQHADRKQLSGWIRQGTELLLPVAQCIRAYGLRAPVVTAANIAIASRGGGTRRLWGYAATGLATLDGGMTAVPRAIWFQVTPDRRSVYARLELNSYRGLLMAPPSTGYEGAVDSKGASLIGCWRLIASRARNLAIIEPNANGTIQALLDAIDALRKIEAQYLKASCEERHRARQEKSLPIVEALHERLDQARTDPDLRPHLANLLADIGAQWASLCLFIKHPAIDMENGALDKKLKSLTKRDPWIFTWHPSAPIWSAAIFTILETCAANGVNATDYIRWLLPQLDCGQDSILTEAAMPWNQRQHLDAPT